MTPPPAEKQAAQDVFDAAPAAKKQAPRPPANRPLPGLGGAPLGGMPGGVIGPATGPRPVGPGGAAGLLPQGPRP